MAIFVETTLGIESDAMHSFSTALNASVSEMTVPTCGDPCVLTFLGFWTAKDMGLPDLVYNRFVSSSGGSSFFSLSVSVPFSSDEAIRFAEKVQKELDKLRVQWLGNSTVTLLGIPAFIPVMIQDVESDLGFMDAIVIPISFSLCLVLTFSLRLLILPAVGMLLSLAFSFCSVALIALATPIMSYIPSLLMSVTLSMSFDYSLFLSHRLREELLKHPEREWEQHISKVLSTAGHTIVVSGGILCCTFLMMCFLPLEFVRNTGLCASLAIVFALAVNLLVIPTLLLTFPIFFAKCVEPNACCKGEIRTMFALLMS